MANWTDGPEYAPTERPAAFETPPMPPLEVPPVVPNPAAGAPVTRPVWQPPQAATVPLDALVPRSGLDPRSPTAPFTTTSSLATAGTAWGSAHSATGTLAHPGWTPDQPLATTAPVNSSATRPDQTSWPAPTEAAPPRALDFPPPTQPPVFPQRGTPDWFAPPVQGQRRPPDQTVTVAQMWQAATPGLIIVLIVGALLSPLSVVMLGVAALLAGRVRYRLTQVRRVFAWSFVLLAVVGALSLFNNDLDLEAAWSVLSGWAQLLCWAVPLIVLLQVGAGIRANEPPTRP
ncbi:hypothetical protein [Micropruina sp.]|uniref:hypothetical protein n=1 Tax=Micropruina sp. TaxID=2737536 RepID=UPI0039E682FB